MRPLAAAALVAGAYLLGSISFSYLIVRVLQGRDVRTVGSGNAGATNVLRAAGKLPGIAALVLDVAKGVAAVVIARSLAAPPPVVGGCAVAVVLGHVFPVFLGFRGGKGVATAAGALGALAPLALVPAVVVLVAVVAWKRYVSLGSIVAALTFPAALALGRAAAGSRPTAGSSPPPPPSPCSSSGSTARTWRACAPAASCGWAKGDRPPRRMKRPGKA